MAPDFFLVEPEVARRLGVLPGPVPLSLASELTIFTNWVSPLVFAGPYEIYDFTKGYDAHRPRQSRFGIGRYNEDRKGMYTTELFTSGKESRSVHVGVDMAAPAGTPVFAPAKGEVWGSEILSQAGDYGGLLILKIQLQTGSNLYVLFGHLSHATTTRWRKGDSVEAGELLGWLGDSHENGGWNPHLHLQLSCLEPVKVDLPGAVLTREREIACRVFPDPMILLRSAIAGLGREPTGG